MSLELDSLTIFKYKKGDTVKHKNLFNKKLNQYCFVLESSPFNFRENYYQIIKLDNVNNCKFSHEFVFNIESNLVTSRVLLTESNNVNL